MKILYSLIVVLTVLVIQPLAAQQLGAYTFFRNNWQMINPSMPNLSFFSEDPRYFTLNMAYRQQWIGTKGGPALYNINFDNIFDPKLHNSTAKGGFGLYGEQLGALRTNGFYGNYTYGVIFGGKTTDILHIGMNTGMSWQRVNLNGINFTPNVNDDVLNSWQNKGSQLFFELNPGVTFTHDAGYGNFFYAGLSVPQAFSVGVSGVHTGVSSLRKQQFNLLVGGMVSGFQPSLWVRWLPSIEYSSLFNNNPLSAHGNVRYFVEKSFWVGAGASTSRLAHFEVGLPQILNQRQCRDMQDAHLSMGLAYDVPLWRSAWLLGPTIELNLQFSWGQ
jgi:type IX secretion system PorP/SprF family membrane protein